MMKKILFFVLCLGICTVGTAQTVKATKTTTTKASTKQAEITFDSTTYDFGTFSTDKAVQTCTFTFTNTGDAPLIIHQAVASCGCTVPKYSKEPIRPGQKGTVEVTYNGTGKFAGVFKKSITVRSNAKTDVVRLTISGNMTEVQNPE
jgi:hypothetical protein